MTMMDAALKYAEANIPVIPLHWICEDGSCSCKAGSDCDSKGKHPLYTGWYKNSTTDVEQIKKWWTKTPNANIGIPTGEKSDWLVLDVDDGGEGRLIKVIYPEKNEESFEYDENNNKITYVNGRYKTTRYEYDPYNRLTKVTDAKGNTTQYQHDRWGNLTKMVNGLGHTTQYNYDELNRLIYEQDPQGHEKQYRYDAVGNRIWSKDPNGTISQYTYTPNNLVNLITLTNGDQTQRLEYEYDEAGYRKLASNQGVVTRYNTDADGYHPDPYGRIYSETKTYDGKSYQVSYKYDVMGRITGVKYPTGNWVNYQYNRLGELVKVPGYLNEAPVYENGLLKSYQAANGVTATLNYDNNGRFTKLNYANAGTVLKDYTYKYDGANNIINKNNDLYQYDELNQLIFANLEGKFETDPKDNVQQVGQVLQDFKGDQPLEFLADQLKVIELDYAAGSIGVDLQTPLEVHRIELKPQTPASRIAKRNLAVYYSDTNSNYVKVENWQLATGSNGKLEIVLDEPVVARYWKVKSLFDDRDKDFNLVSKAQFVNQAKDIIQVYYLFDQRQEEYTYDAIGNRKTEKITEQTVKSKTYQYYPNSSRLMTNGKYAYVYDANGNLIKKGTNFSISGSEVTFTQGDGEYWEYQYDLLNRLIQVKKNNKVIGQYLYDEGGLRLKKTGSEGTTNYVFDQSGQIIYEEEKGSYLEYIYVLGKHFARVDGNLDNSIRKTYFYQTDHLGSTVAVTDEAGKTVWTSEYTPFGGKYSTTGVLANAAKFTRKDLDEDIGLYYFNARWYDSETGRFVEEDSIPIDPNNPITLNRYTYCSNNPINRIDPSGHMDYATQSDDLLRGIVDGVGDQLKGLKEAPKAIMIIADGIIRGDITLKQLAEAGLESVIGDYKYILENASVFNPFQKNSDKEVYEMGKHLSGIAVDVTMAATGTGAAKLFTALSKTKSGAKIVKALKTLKTAMKDEGGYINPSAFTKKVAGNSDDLVDQRLMRLDLEGTPKTGTVYDNIKITQPVYEGTQIPKSFEITTANGQKMWVHPNATEHMFEYVTRNLNHSRNINSQQMLSSFESALNQAVKNGVQFDKMIKVGNWEFKFAAPRGEGLLPVVKHAQYIP